MTRTLLLVLGVFTAVGFAAVVLVAIPRVLLVRIEPAAGLEPYTETERRGRAIYIADGCLYCHSQQVRDPAFTPDVERAFGARASLPADYVYDRPHLLGTMRTGPDLLNVAGRLPDRQWHLIHLYDPRALVPWSIMPRFRHHFALREPDAVEPNDVVVPVPAERVPEGRVVVATPDALALVDYLMTLDRDGPVAADAADLGVDSRYWCGLAEVPEELRRPAAGTP